VQTTLPQGVFLRTTLMNPRTEERDLDAMLDAVRCAARN
jgi:L-2,4-diaminobutyrate decarboxylase